MRRLRSNSSSGVPGRGFTPRRRHGTAHDRHPRAPCRGRVEPRAGPRLTRDGFVAALEGMRDVDLGGMTVRFSPTHHTGSDFVDLTMISRDGKYIR